MTSPIYCSPTILRLCVRTCTKSAALPMLEARQQWIGTTTHATPLRTSANTPFISGTPRRDTRCCILLPCTSSRSFTHKQQCSDSSLLALASESVGVSLPVAVPVDRNLFCCKKHPICACRFDAVGIATYLLSPDKDKRHNTGAHNNAELSRTGLVQRVAARSSAFTPTMAVLDSLLPRNESQWILDCIGLSASDPHLQVFAASASRASSRQRGRTSYPQRSIIFAHFAREWVYDPLTGQLFNETEVVGPVRGGKRIDDAAAVQRRRDRRNFFVATRSSLGVRGLDLGKDTEFVNLRAEAGSEETALHLACAVGSIRLAELLMSFRADPSMCNRQGLSAVAVAAQHARSASLLDVVATEL